MPQRSSTSGPRGATPTSKKRGHDVHLDVAQHRGAQHADELGLARRTERDEHAPDAVLDDDAVEIVDVADERTRQAGIRRTDEAGQLEAVLGMHDDEVRELDTDVAGAGDERRLAQTASTRAAQQRVADRAHHDDGDDREHGLPEQP